MMAIFLVLSIAVIMLLLLYFVFYRKKEFQKESPKKFIEKSSKYICDECGEKDCICHRVDDIK